MSDLRRLSEKEFIALTAMLYATIAFSIDAMLPALTRMGQELSPASPENITLVVGIFLVGMGLGMVIAGPLSDAFGRKPIILGGYALYIIGALVAAIAPNLEWILLGRLIQGIAVAGPRIATLAMVRDLYSGERMAAVSSLSMAIFLLVPAVAPMIGQAIMSAFGWRAIFVSFIIFALLVGSWMQMRQPETLARDKRVPASWPALRSAFIECFSNRIFRISVLILSLTLSGLFAMISSVQPIYALSFDAAETFPYWFAATTLLALPSNYLNARLVMRFGMRILIKIAITFGIISSLIALILLELDQMTIWVFFGWASCFLFSIGFVFGNLTTLSMEPMGHIAGLAASVNGAVSTVLSAALAMPISLASDGTPKALLIGVLISFGLSFLIMLRLGKRPVAEHA